MYVVRTVVASQAQRLSSLLNQRQATRTREIPAVIQVLPEIDPKNRTTRGLSPKVPLPMSAGFIHPTGTWFSYLLRDQPVSVKVIAEQQQISHRTSAPDLCCPSLVVTWAGSANTPCPVVLRPGRQRHGQCGHSNCSSFAIRASQDDLLFQIADSSAGLDCADVHGRSFPAWDAL